MALMPLLAPPPPVFRGRILRREDAGKSTDDGHSAQETKQTAT
jgi:hypothetical protein